MTNSGVVTEIVEIPLSVSFAEFLHKFQLELLPVLLGEEGVISVRTGVKIKTSEDSANAWAVSFTEWDSLDSHAKFVQKPSSAAFFETSSKLSTGPPTIDHYRFGSLKSLGGSDCSRALFTNDRGGGEPGSISAESLDHEILICSLSPLKSEHEHLPRDAKRSFHVLWYSYERKVQRPNL